MMFVNASNSIKNAVFQNLEFKNRRILPDY